jgi:hypothetical protein
MTFIARLKKHHVPVLLALIVLFALGLRLWNHDYELEHVKGNKPMPLAYDSYSKVEMARIFASGHSSPHYFRQPYFLIYTSGAIFKLRLAMNGADAASLWTETAALWQVTVLYMIACSVLTVLLLYFIGMHVFGDKYVSLLSALLFSVIPVSVIGSRYFKEDIPLMLFLNLTMFLFLWILAKPTWYNYLLAGILAGISVAVKYSAVQMIPLYILVHIAAVVIHGRDKPIKAAFSPWFFLGLILIAVTFLAFNPYIIPRWEEFCAALKAQAGYAGRGHNDGTSISGPDYWWTFYLRYAVIPGMTIPLALASLAGIVMALRRRSLAAAFIVAWMFYVYFSVEASKAKPFPFFARYIHAVFPFLCMFAAYALVEFFRKSRNSPATRCLAVVLILVCVGTPLAKTALINAAIKEDTRVIGSEWINSNLPEGAVICLDDAYYSPRPSGKKFELDYASRMHHRTIAKLQEKKVNYVVLNSFRADRYEYSWKFSKKAKLRRDYYEGLVEYGTLIKEILPRFAFQTYGFHNPVIRIYQLPPVPVNGKAEDISAGE